MPMTKETRFSGHQAGEGTPTPVCLESPEALGTLVRQQRRDVLLLIGLAPEPPAKGIEGDSKGQDAAYKYGNGQVSYHTSYGTPRRGERKDPRADGLLDR